MTTLPGFGGTVISTGAGSSLSQWRVLNSTIDRQKAMVASDFQNKADAEYARQKLPTIGTPDELMADRRLYTYVMRAFGLEDQINSQALVRKILESDMSDSNSYANRIADVRFRELAIAFNFGGTSDSSFADQIGALYARENYEEGLGKKNAALPQMLDFTRKMTSMSDWGDVLADEEMAGMVRLAYGLPEPYGPVDEASQAALMQATLPFSAVKAGATALDTFQTRFFDAWDIAGNPRGSSVSSKSQWTMLMRNYEAQLAASETQYTVRSNLAYLDQKLSGIRSADDLLKDGKLLGIVLKAYDLEHKASDVNYLRKVLESDPASENSFAAKEGAQTRALAQAFSFASTGTKRRGSPAFVEDVVKRYETQSLEVSAGNTNDALRLGLYFERKAPSITSWYQVLADKALAELVRTALNIPAESAQMDLDRQVAFISGKFDIAKMKDPDEVKKLTERFMLMWDVNGNASSNVSSAPSLQLFTGRTSIDASTLLAAATLRRY